MTIATTRAWMQAHEHNTNPAIFEDEPQPAMRRASVALASAHAHADDGEVRDLLASAAALVERACDRQLALERSGHDTLPALPFPAERAYDSSRNASPQRPQTMRRSRAAERHYNAPPIHSTRETSL